MRLSMTPWLYVGLALPVSGCAEPDLASDLVTAGPPTVSAVTITGESGWEATYCNAAMGDHTPLACTAGQPVEPAGDVRPLAWTARVVFKELLDPDIEVIDAQGNGSIRDANPFTITCGGAGLTYDGFYDPSGNHETSPPGPALVIHGVTNPALATGTPCQIAIRPGAIRDKDGDAAPDDTTFGFAIAPLHVVATTPKDQATGIAPGAMITIALNSRIDATSLTDHVSLRAGAVAVAATVRLATDAPTTIVIAPDAPLAAGTEYAVTVDPAVRDSLGGALTQAITFTFTTAP